MSQLATLLRTAQEIRGLQFAFAGMPEHFSQERRTALQQQRQAAAEQIRQDLLQDPFAYLLDPIVQGWIEALKKHPKVDYKVGPTVDHWLLRGLPLKLTGFVYADQEEYDGDHGDELIPRPTYGVELAGQDLGTIVLRSAPNAFDYMFGIDNLDDRALRTYIEQQAAAIREGLRTNPFETMILMETAGDLADVLEAELQHELRALVYITNRIYWETQQTP